MKPALRIHQLLAGRDFATDARNPVCAMAAQMSNFVYAVVSVSEPRALLLVDPAWDVDGLLRVARERLGFSDVAGAVFTHRHLDHTGGRVRLGGGSDRTKVHVPGLEDMVKRKVPVFVGADDVEATARQTGVAVSSIHAVREGDAIAGFPGVRVLHTPGHTPGSICLSVDDGKFLITGDTLFIGACGRVDLAESNALHMMRSLARLATLPRETIVLPGHNYATPKQSTIGREMDTNFMMQDAVANADEVEARLTTAAATATSPTGGAAGDLSRNLTSASRLPDYLAAAHRALHDHEEECREKCAAM